MANTTHKNKQAPRDPDPGGDQALVAPKACRGLPAAQQTKFSQAGNPCKQGGARSNPQQQHHWPSGAS
eukprot:8264663-Alexandrium_andersonii.AAC.1